MVDAEKNLQTLAAQAFPVRGIRLGGASHVDRHLSVREHIQMTDQSSPATHYTEMHADIPVVPGQTLVKEIMIAALHGGPLDAYQKLSAAALAEADEMQKLWHPFPALADLVQLNTTAEAYQDVMILGKALLAVVTEDETLHFLVTIISSLSDSIYYQAVVYAFPKHDDDKIEVGAEVIAKITPDGLKHFEVITVEDSDDAEDDADEETVEENDIDHNKLAVRAAEAMINLYHTGYTSAIWREVREIIHHDTAGTSDRELSTGHHIYVQNQEREVTVITQENTTDQLDLEPGEEVLTIQYGFDAVLEDDAQQLVGSLSIRERNYYDALDDEDEDVDDGYQYAEGIAPGFADEPYQFVHELTAQFHDDETGLTLDLTATHYFEASDEQDATGKYNRASLTISDGGNHLLTIPLRIKNLSPVLDELTDDEAEMYDQIEDHLIARGSSLFRLIARTMEMVDIAIAQSDADLRTQFESVDDDEDDDDEERD